MRDRAVESMRLVLTVIGLLLLVIFGVRAASQVGNLKLAGANHRFEQPSSVPILNLASLAFEPATLHAAKAVLTRSEAPAHPKPQQAPNVSSHEATSDRPAKGPATAPGRLNKTKSEIPPVPPSSSATYPTPIAPRPVTPPRPGLQPYGTPIGL